MNHMAAFTVNQFKKIMAVALALTLILPANLSSKTAQTAQAAQLTSLVVDGGFEHEGDAGVWNLGDSGFFSVTDEDAHEGTYSLKYVGTGYGEVKNTSYDVLPSTTYVLSYWAKVTDWQGVARVSIFEFDNDWNTKQSHWDKGGVWSTTDGWVQKTYEFTTNADTTIIQLALAVNVGGTAYFDEVTLLPKATASDVFVNGDFDTDGGEADLTGWNNIKASDTQEQMEKKVLFSRDFESNEFNDNQGNNANATIVSGEGVNGSNALKIERTDESTTSHPFIYFTPSNLDTTGTVQYTLSFKLRSTGAHWQGYIVENGATASWGAIGWTAANNAWTEYTYHFVTTTGKAQIGIQLVQGSGNVYIDDFDISVSHTEEAPVVMTEGVGAFGADGSNALKVDTMTDVYNTATADNLTEGATYNYSVDVKIEQAGEGFEFIPYIDNCIGGFTTIDGYRAADTDWTTITGSFVAPAKSDVAGIRIGFYRRGTGTVYVDNFTLFEKDTVVIPSSPIAPKYIAVSLDGAEVAQVDPEGGEYTLPTDAKYGYYCDGKMYKAGSEVTVTEDMAFTSVNELSVTMVDKAGIRYIGSAGIRFQSTITSDNMDAVDSAAITEGTLITAVDIYESKGQPLTLTSDYTKIDVKNSGWYAKDDALKTRTYCGSICNVIESNYIRHFTARAYVTVTYVDGEAVTYYSNMGPDRTISGVAAAVKADGYPGIVEEYRSVIDSFIKE